MTGAGLLHGGLGLVPAYLATLSAYAVGLATRRASVEHYVWAPLAAVPLTAGGLLLGSLLAGLLHLLGWPAWQRVVVAIAVLAGAALLMGRYRARAEPAAAVRRGAVIAGARAARRSDAAGALTVAGVALSPGDETKHFKFIGTTGTGKSTAIHELIGAALARGDRAVIADPEGGYLARHYDAARGDIILNPFDARAVRWDPYRELRAPYDPEQLARTLVGDGHGQEQSWRSYAQAFIAALLRQTQGLPGDRLTRLYQLLSCAPLPELRLLLAGTGAAPLLEEGNERMFGSVRAVAMAASNALQFVQAQAAPAFSVRDWVQHGRGVLFLPYHADQIAALRSLISSWLRLAIFQTMSQGEVDHRLWFAIDELDALGPIDGLTDALARLRKFGGRCVLGFQSIAQVSGTYGEAAAHTIVENCGNTLILRCSASEGGGTARFAARLIGEREVLRVQVSRSRGAGLFAHRHETISRGEQSVIEPAILAAEIERLPDLAGYLKVASRPDWMRVDLTPASAAAGSDRARHDGLDQDPG